MTPGTLAALHARAMAPDRGWSEQEFEALLQSPIVQLFHETAGFALVRVVADEAELLMLAVDREYRRKGVAERLMRRWMRSVAAVTAHLEVASDNIAARALYDKLGFETSGLRRGYYVRRNAPAADAVLMQVALPLARSGHLQGQASKTG